MLMLVSLRVSRRARNHPEVSIRRITSLRSFRPENVPTFKGAFYHVARRVATHIWTWNGRKKGGARFRAPRRGAGRQA